MELIKKFESTKLIKRGNKKFIKDLPSNYNELVSKVEGLYREINKLKAELFAVKNPNGKIEAHNKGFFYNDDIYFTYSDGSKIFEIKIDSFSENFDFYKIQIFDDKAYLGIKTVDDDEIEEWYYIVDMSRGTVIEIVNDSIDNFDSTEWSKKCK